MSRRWLVLRIEAPLIAFGGVAVDQVGPTRAYPAASMLTGLLANALGWRWSDRAAHQNLQDRLVFGAAVLREGTRLTDTQNAKLGGNDVGWTTWGAPEGRAGASYDAPHRRRRDYLVDAALKLVLRLEHEDASPTLKDLAAALDRPARPIFLGRKPCLPTAPILAGWCEGENVHAALLAAARTGRATWPLGEGPSAGEGVERIVDLPDLRNWRTGLHGGARRVVEGRLG